jgi:hypothetical protein
MATQSEIKTTRNTPLIIVLIANCVMACTATAPVYSLSLGKITTFGLAVIFGSMALMNLVAGGGLSLFKQAEGKYFLRFGLVYFILSILVFIVPTFFLPPQ